MKLEELLKQITPGPWGVGITPNLIGMIGPVRQLVAETHGEGQTLVHNAAYITHAANVLPELVRAAREIESIVQGIDLAWIDPALKTATDRLYFALNDAEDVQ